MSDLRSEKRWRVLDVRGSLEYPRGDDVLEKLIKGHKVPKADRDLVIYLSGDVAEDVPATSVDWLVDRGWICEAGTAEDPYHIEPAAADLAAEHGINVRHLTGTGPSPAQTGQCFKLTVRRLRDDGTVEVSDLPRKAWPERFREAQERIEAEPTRQITVADVEAFLEGGPPEIDATDAALDLLAEAGIDPADVTGTGEDGRILKKDAQKAIAEAGDATDNEEASA